MRFPEFFAKGALYQELTLPHDEVHALYWVINHLSLRFDTYCPQCKQNTTWRLDPVSSLLPGDVPPVLDGTHVARMRTVLACLRLDCARVGSHRLYLSIDVRSTMVKGGTRTRVESVTLEKFGQLPSIADIASSEVDAYSKFIDEADLKELKRAIGLAAHGIGIGSFVYLRRIFERLVAEAAKKAKSDGDNIDLEEFSYLRMEDKLEVVKNHVPEWMVQNRKLYGILSLGLHELTDDTCIAAFPAVKQATLSLLEQHAETEMRKARAKAAAVVLEELKRKLEPKSEEKPAVPDGST